MPVTCGKREEEISQRKQYALGGIGRRYWDYRDQCAFSYLKPGTTLDAGCGEGITLEKMTALFPESQVQGIDGDPENVRICTEHQLNAQTADLYSLPFDDESFNNCTFMEVIEHLDKPVSAVRELNRVTKQNGRLIVIYPIDLTMYIARLMCGKFREARFDPGHLRQWTRRALKALLESCGYRITGTRSLPLPWPATLHGLVVAEKIRHIPRTDIAKGDMETDQ